MVYKGFRIVLTDYGYDIFFPDGEYFATVRSEERVKNWIDTIPMLKRCRYLTSKDYAIS